jgi:hypothetical protein
MNQLRSSKISYDQLRSLVIEYIGKVQDDPTLQLNNLRDGVGEVAATRGLLEPGCSQLSQQDHRRSCDIIWDLIIDGIVRPGGGNNTDAKLPWFHVTDRGRELLAHGSLSPYDPDGYLSRLNNDVPYLDPIVRVYLVESLHTFRIGSLLSSTITLGCASERAILILIDAYADALPKSDGDAFKKKTQGTMIKTRFDAFEKSAKHNERLKSAVPPAFKDTLDNPIKSIFEMYRAQRNDAGHPTGTQFVREEAHAHLVIFPHYIKRLYLLTDWLRNNPVP